MVKIKQYAMPVYLFVFAWFLGLHAPPLHAAAEHANHFSGGVVLLDGLVGAHAVRTGDLDRDGDLDVVAAGRESGRVVWLENDGAPFPQFSVHEVGYVQGAYALAVADLNRDGNLDIVVVGAGELRQPGDENATPNTGSILWFENNLRAGGGFTPHVVAVGLPYSVDIHVADLDRDGDLDILIAARDGNRISWYENNGANPPAFVEHLVTTSALGAVSVHVGDMNGNGLLDIIAASEQDNKIAIHRSDGANPPTFTEVVAYQPMLPTDGLDLAKSVFAADIDGDGDLDIAYVGEDNNEVGWLENVGGDPPTFVPHVLATDVAHAKVVVALDLDRDGDLDILVASAGDNQIVWFEHGGDRPPTFTKHIITTTALGARDVHAADLDGDGDIDVLSASRNDNRIIWYPNRATSRTALYNENTQSIIHVYRGARHVQAADMNQDGHMDLLAIFDDQVLWFENDGASPPGFSPNVVGANTRGGRWVAVGDLDGDGDLDVVAASHRNNQISWYENLGGAPPTFATHIVTQDARGARAVLVADLNRDGKLDLYSASDSDNAVYWYENLGGRPPQFRRHVVSLSARYARSVYAADLDGDGDLDLMSASQDDGKVAWYENLGGSPIQWREHILEVGAYGVQHVHADDLDGDGDIDVVVAVEYDNTIRWYENLGGSPPQFQMHLVTNNAPAVHAVYTGDADQDGDVDIFAAIEGSNTVAWYENVGGTPPTFLEHIVVTNTLVAHGIYAADIDGDGDLDIISASRDDGKVAWYENLGGHYAMSATVNPNNSAILHVVVTHRGRPGDAAMDLAYLELRLLDAHDAPFSTDQANTMISRIDVHRVPCCEHIFDAAGAPILATASPLALTDDGRQMIRLLNQDLNPPIPAGGSAAYTVIIQGGETSCEAGAPAYRAVNIAGQQVAVNAETGAALLAETMRPNDRAPLPTEPERSPIVINEFMASNETYAVNPNAPRDFPDWIELYNSSPVAVNLSGYYLTDDLTLPDKHRIADGVIIRPYGFLVFYADGAPERGWRHLSFRLDRAGEAIGLYEPHPTGLKIVDEYVFGPQPRNLSEGRYPNGGPSWKPLGAPTPGRPNLDFASAGSVYLPVVNRAVVCP